MARQSGLFDVDERLRLSGIGDQLETFAAVVDFEMFRPELVAALNYSDGSKGGRPPFDPVLMFKILVIQAQNNLSDDRAEFLINDRLSFMRFLGLGLGDKVPDAKTIWAFRERLTKAGAIEALFARFDRAIRGEQANAMGPREPVHGYIPLSGQIVDASLVSAPKQCNTEAEKKAVKEGRIPEEWTAKPAKLRHKDRDARWTLVTGQGAPARGRLPARRHRDPGLRLQEPRQHRPPARLHPEMGRDRGQPPRRPDTAARAARHDQHRHDGLGRQRLSLESKRGLHGAPRLPRPGPPPQAEGPADAVPHPPRQRQPLKRPRGDPARLRTPKGTDGSLHPNDRHRPRPGEDRTGEPHLQHPAAGPSRPKRRDSMSHSLKTRPNSTRQSSHPPGSRPPAALRSPSPQPETGW